MSPPAAVSLPIISHKGEREFPKGLWFVGNNFATGGSLGRLDLETGLIQHNILKVGPDTIVVPDSNEAIFMLNRQGQDSIARIKGVKADIESSREFLKDSNPQTVIRDLKGNIWVSFLELNQIHVYSPNLKELVAQVDLTHLGIKGIDGSIHADLGPMAVFDDHIILIAAQRLHRDRSWAPDKNSGLAYINSDSYAVESSHFIELSNPTLLKTEPSKSRVTIVGKGDFVDVSGLMGQVLFFDQKNLSSAQTHFYNGKIIAADFAEGSDDPALIVWYPKDNKSCIQMGEISIVCAGSPANQGYVFSAIRQVSNIIFVSYFGNQTSELWVIDFKTGEVSGEDSGEDSGENSIVQRIPMDLPLFSLSFGP